MNCIRKMEEHLTCPLTLHIFRDPVTFSDGHTYEKEALEEALEYAISNNNGQFKSPVTSETFIVEGYKLRTNLMVKNIIEELIEEHAEIKDMVYVPLGIFSKERFNDKYFSKYTDEEMLELLKKVDKELFHKNFSCGYGIIHVCAKFGFVKSVKYCVEEHNVDPQMEKDKKQNGETALYVALLYRNKYNTKKVIKYLLSKVNKIDLEFINIFISNEFNDEDYLEYIKIISIEQMSKEQLRVYKITLYQCAKYGLSKSLKYLIENMGMNPEMLNSDSFTPLTMGICNINKHNKETINYLLTKVNKLDKQTLYYLFEKNVIIQLEDETVLKIAKLLNYNQLNKSISKVHKFAMYNFLKTFKYCIEERNIYIKTKIGGDTFLSVAIKYNAQDVINYILSKIDKLSKDGINTFISVTINSNFTDEQILEIIKKIDREDFHINNKSFGIIHVCSVYNRFQSLKYCIDEMSVDPKMKNTNNDEPFDLIVNNNSVENITDTLNYLLLKMDKFDIKKIKWIIKNRPKLTDEVKEKIKKYVKENKLDIYPFNELVNSISKNVEINIFKNEVNFFLDLGFDINVPNPETSFTPLDTIIYLYKNTCNDNNEMKQIYRFLAEILLNAGADSSKGNYLEILLGLDSEINNDFFMMLIQHGAFLNKEKWSDIFSVIIRE